MIFDMTIFSNNSIFRLPFSLEDQKQLTDQGRRKRKGAGGTGPIDNCHIVSYFLYNNVLNGSKQWAAP